MRKREPSQTPPAAPPSKLPPRPATVVRPRRAAAAPGPAPAANAAAAADAREVPPLADARVCLVGGARGNSSLRVSPTSSAKFTERMRRRASRHHVAGGPFSTLRSCSSTTSRSAVISALSVSASDSSCTCRLLCRSCASSQKAAGSGGAFAGGGAGGVAAAATSCNSCWRISVFSRRRIAFSSASVSGFGSGGLLLEDRCPAGALEVPAAGPSLIRMSPMSGIAPERTLVLPAGVAFDDLARRLGAFDGFGAKDICKSRVQILWRAITRISVKNGVKRSRSSWSERAADAAAGRSGCEQRCEDDGYWYP